MEKLGAVNGRWVLIGIATLATLVFLSLLVPPSVGTAVAAVCAASLAAFAWRLLDLLRAERQRPERPDDESGQAFQVLIDGINDYAICTLDTDGLVTCWNSGAERINGYGREEIIGQHFSCFYSDDDQQEGRPEGELEIARTTGRFEEEGWRVRRDGSRFWANVTISTLQDERGRLCGYSEVVRDHSDGKAAVDQIQQLNSDLKRRVAEQAAANRELKQKNRENEMFVYSVSHDLRSPLVNLQGFSKELGLVCEDLREILAEDHVPADVQTRGSALIDQDIAESIHFMQSAVLRLSHIIDALLQLSRVGRIEYRPQDLDVQGIACRVVEALAGTISEKDARVTVRDLPPAGGDPTAVEQVFANLLNNALKYLDPQRPGAIEVGYSAEVGASGQNSQRGAYYVRDNGLGIAEEYQAKIFHPFQRVHGNVAPGEGMGLAIIQRIVERHSGEIWLESAPGEGTTFFVTLPTAATLATEHQHDELCSATDERKRENGCRTLSHSAGGR